MSIKRQAATDLNHENWDREDSTEREEMGTFKTASKEVLEKRIIRTAKRRSQVSSDEPNKSVFSGFGGFKKMQQSSFDFLANLTNGSKLNTVQPGANNDTAIQSSSVFTNKSLSSSPSSGIFSMSGSSGFVAKSTLGKPSEGALFAGSADNDASPIQSVFTATKDNFTVNNSPFKLQPSPAIDSVAKPNVNQDASTSQVSSAIFGAQSNSPNESLFSSTTASSTLFSTQAVSSTSTSPMNNITTATASANAKESDSNSDKTEEKQVTYYSKLRGLNESVSEWIKKHVEETPLCILTPIFKDYEVYLKEILKEDDGDKSCNENNENKTEPKPPTEETNLPTSNNMNSSNFGTSTPSNIGNLETAQSNKSDITTKSSSLGFGINTSTTTTTTTGFSFGINPSTPSAPLSLFPLNTSTTTNASTPFSFGINKSGFGFNTISPPKTETPEVAQDEDDEPPKVEFTPVVEENSIFEVKCKIFVKKDGIFIDNGVGTLYIKKIEESGKHQLLVRANTNLGSVLLNLVLSSSIPTQRMGKNNIMLVCIPTPDAKPPPTPILIRVKTAEEADELLNTLNKYKA